MTACVIVIDDTSSMWGPVVRVFGPYPSRVEAGKDYARLNGIYPRKNFINCVDLTAGEVAPAPAPRPKMAAKR